MPEKRLARTREANEEINCKHNWFIVNDSFRAAFILPDGRRETQYYCYNCGAKKSKIRSEAIYDKELNDYVSDMFGLIKRLKSNE